MMTTAKDIVITADWHVNSVFGLWPPGFVDMFGNAKPQNEGQEYTYEKFLDGIDCLPDPIHVGIINGDPVDGMAPKDKSWAQMTPNVNTQDAACVAVARPFTERVETLYMTESSRYHQTVEEASNLARRLGAKPTSPTLYARPFLRLRIGNVYLEVRHKLGSPRRWTATAMQQELLDARAAAIKDGYTPSVIAASHWHNYLVVEDAYGVAVTSPGWELQNRFAEERRPKLWIPDLGFLHIRIYPERYRFGRKAWAIERLLYKHPDPPIEEVVVERA